MRREVLIPELSSNVYAKYSTESNTKSLLKGKEGEKGESSLCGFAAVS